MIDKLTNICHNLQKYIALYIYGSILHFQNHHDSNYFFLFLKCSGKILFNSSDVKNCSSSDFNTS